MKAYQGLHKPSRKSFFIMVEEDWRVVQALPDFCELRDENGVRISLWRDVIIEELPAMQAKVLGATNRT